MEKETEGDRERERPSEKQRKRGEYGAYYCCNDGDTGSYV